MKNTIDILKQGREARLSEHIEKERKSIGTLRGGSVGCVLSDGKVIGTCPREAIARFLGWSKTHDESTHLMFEMGHLNEVAWTDLLDATGQKYDREKQIQWSIKGPSGIVSVTGRPDLILLNDVSQRLLELKMIASVWTARNVLLEFSPKVENLIQGANYLWQKQQLEPNIQFTGELWYTSYINLSGPDFIRNVVPKRGADRSEWIEYTLGEMGTNKLGKPSFKKIHVYNNDWHLPNEVLEKRYGVTASQFKHIRPFRVGYKFWWNDKQQLCWTALDGSTKDTVLKDVTVQGIENYYKLVLSSIANKTLPNTPVAMKSDGSLDDKFDPGDYSSLQWVSDMAKGDYNEWMKYLYETETMLKKDSK